MLRQNRYQQAVTIAGIYAAIATCFFIPLSTTLTDYFALFTFICWIFSGKVFELPLLMQRSPVTIVSILLFLLFVIGAFYSSLSLPSSLKYLNHYKELLYFPAVMSILEDNQQAKLNAEYSFVIGSIILLFISYLIHFSILNIHGYEASNNFQTHNFFVAILAFWSANYLLESKQYRYLWLLILITAAYDAIFMTPGKTGMLVLLFLTILFIFQRLSLKKCILTLLLICSLVMGSFFVSTTVSSRFHATWNTLASYEYGVPKTFFGQKLDWWRDSMKLIKHKPLFGYGTGGFVVAHNGLIKEEKIKQIDNPYNEYLFITIQLGLIGLGLFIALFIVQWSCAQKLPGKDKYLVHGVIIAMASGCMLNSFLFASQQGHFFIFLSGIFFATTPRCPLILKKSATLSYR